MPGHLCGAHVTKMSQCTVRLFPSPKDSHITVTWSDSLLKSNPVGRTENMKINMSYCSNGFLTNRLEGDYECIVFSLSYHIIYLYKRIFFYTRLVILYFICSCYPTQDLLMQWMLLHFIMFSKDEMLKKVKSLRKRGTYMVPTKYYACEQKTITHNPAVFSYDCVVHDVQIVFINWLYLICGSTCSVRMVWTLHIAYVFLFTISKFFHFSCIPICDTETRCPNCKDPWSLLHLVWFCFCYTKTFKPNIRVLWL